MIRNLKALGLALVAVFAMTAVLASASQAAVKVTTGANPAILTGSVIAHTGITGLVHTFTLAGGQKLSCEETKFSATVASGATSVTVTPTYNKCKAIVGSLEVKATVTMNGCDYVFHGGVNVSTTTWKEGQIDLVCEAGKVVEVHVYKELNNENEELCTLTIPPFANKIANEYHNVAGTPDDVTITTTATGIPVNRDGSLLCGAASTTATYTGSTTLTAFEDLSGTEGNPVGVTISE